MPRVPGGRDFTPISPAGFEVAGTFNGVTTAVGPAREVIRYQRTEVRFPSGGVVGMAVRMVLRAGVGDEVALGGLSNRLATALMMLGTMPEAGLPERLDRQSPAAFVLGRYQSGKAGAQRFGAMALFRTGAGMVEILVSECETEARAREVVGQAMAPYL